MPSISAVGNISPVSTITMPAVVLDHGHVLADLPQPAQGKDPYARALKLSGARRQQALGLERLA